MGGVNSTNIVIDLYDQTGSNYINTLVSGVTNSGSYTGVVYTVAGMYRIKIRDGSYPTLEYSFIGFRVASVPEPGSVVLVVVGGLCLLAYAWRRRRV